MLGLATRRGDASVSLRWRWRFALLLCCEAGDFICAADASFITAEVLGVPPVFCCLCLSRRPVDCVPNVGLLLPFVAVEEMSKALGALPYAPGPGVPSSACITPLFRKACLVGLISR